MSVVFGPVLIPNATIHLGGADRSSFYKTNIRVNMARDQRRIEDLNILLQGRGVGTEDLTKLFRVRLAANTLDGNRQPLVNDTVFVTKHDTNPLLTGWYTVWLAPQPTGGIMPTYILYLHQEVL